MTRLSEAPLTAREAEQVVEDRIEQFGLGALPDVKIRVDSNGLWHVHWDEYERTVAPMGTRAWSAWLEEHVGPLDAGRLQTTES
jgi:hypothetical protein